MNRTFLFLACLEPDPSRTSGPQGTSMKSMRLHTPVAQESPSMSASEKIVSRTAHKKIWIDLDNSPHVPLFLPIMEELRKRGYQVLVTARNSYQVCELLKLYDLQCE